MSQHQTHSARVIDPIRVVASDGHARTIPPGPCLVEELEGDLVDIVWGRAGEQSIAVPTTQAERAEREGKLVLLD
jgi:hypothetical protein